MAGDTYPALDFDGLDLPSLCAILDGSVHDVMGVAGAALAWLDLVSMGKEPPTSEQIAQLRSSLSRSANAWGKAHLRRSAIAEGHAR